MLTNNLFSKRKTTSLAICGLTLLSLTGCSNNNQSSAKVNMSSAKVNMLSVYDSTKEPFSKWYEKYTEKFPFEYVKHVKVEDMLSKITKSADEKTVVLCSSSDANVVDLMGKGIFNTDSLELYEVKTLLKIYAEYEAICNEISQLDKALGVSKEIEEEILSDFILTSEGLILQTEEKSTEYKNEEEDFKVKIIWNQTFSYNDTYEIEVKYEIID